MRGEGGGLRAEGSELRVEGGEWIVEGSGFRVLVECKSCTLVLGVRRVWGGGVRLRFVQLHLKIGNEFLRSFEGRGGLWELVKNFE